MVKWFGRSVVVALLVVLGCVLSLPEGRIPLHWGTDGQPDNWGSRTTAAAVLIGVWAVFAVLMGGFIRWVRTIDLVLVNVPRKDHWSQPEHEPALRARLREDMALTGIWMMAFSALIALLVTVSVHTDNALEPLVIATIAVMLVVLVAGLWARTKFYRAV